MSYHLCCNEIFKPIVNIYPFVLKWDQSPDSGLILIAKGSTAIIFHVFNECDPLHNWRSHYYLNMVLFKNSTTFMMCYLYH